MQKSKIKSGLKKIKSLTKSDAIVEGVKNFNYPSIEVETLAESRTLTCLGCVNYQIEPIKFLRITDVKIPELSEMFCDDCGCTLSYKLRQSIDKCKLWER